MSGEPPVFDIIFTDRAGRRLSGHLTADRGRIERFNQECVRRGVVKAVNKIYVSLAHTDTDVEETLGIFDRRWRRWPPARADPGGADGSQPT